MTMRTKVIVGLIVICLIWGTTWLGIKIGLESVPPLLGAGVRFLIAACALGLIVRITRSKLPTDRRFWKLSALLAVASFGIPYALVYWGQQSIPSGLASILFATYPLFVGMISHVALKQERMSLPKWGGSLLGFAGITTIFWSDFRLEGPAVVGGMAAVVVSAMLQAGALVAARRYGREYSSVSLNLIGMAVASLFLLGASVALESYESLLIDDRAVISVLYLALLGSVVTFVIYFWLVKHVEAVLLSLTAFITPVIAIFVGAIVLGEELPPDILGGSVLVLVGILTANADDLLLLLRQGKSWLFE